MRGPVRRLPKPQMRRGQKLSGTSPEGGVAVQGTCERDGKGALDGCIETVAKRRV
jgi:hypothetical protein